MFLGQEINKQDSSKAKSRLKAQIELENKILTTRAVTDKKTAWRAKRGQQVNARAQSVWSCDLIKQ